MKRVSKKGIICFLALLASPVTLWAMSHEKQQLESKSIHTAAATQSVQLAAHGGGHGGGHWRGGHGGHGGWHGGGRGWHGGGRWHGVNRWHGHGVRDWHGRSWYGRGWRDGRWNGGWVGGVWYGPGAYPVRYRYNSSYYNYGSCGSYRVYRRVCSPVCYWSDRYQAERCRTKCYSSPYLVRRCW